MSDPAPSTPPHEAHVPLHLPPTSPQRPKGILKNASQSNVNGPKLTWDEENLAATEIDKDSLMKIDEPKTPFVRYNKELDNETEGDIPSLELDNSAPTSPFATTFHEATAKNTAANAGRPPASPSSSSGGRPRVRSSSSDRGKESGRPSFSTTRSGSSSRSTSFSMPPDDLGRTEFREGGLGLLRGEDDVLDDEEALDEETAAKRAEFRKARGRHYSNEAEAMKRAQALMAAEEDEEDSDDARMHDGDGHAIPRVPAVPNGLPR